MKKIYSVLVENRSGVLSKVTGLFSRRAFNINSLVVGETDDPTISRMTIVSTGDSHTLEQIEKMAEESDFSFMTGIDEVLSRYDKVILADRNATRLCNGITITIAGIEDGTTVRAYNEQGKFLALCSMENGKVNVIRAFYGEAPK